MTRIAYLVHNLADSAVGRRIAMFRAGGAEVVVAGFCRDTRPPVQVAGAYAISLGQTHDAALGQRAGQVAANLVRPAGLLSACKGADVIVARNLETLALARFAARRLGIRRVVYECLDIHRAMLGEGIASKAMRASERWMMRGCSLLLTSSPAFLREYFQPRQKLATPAMLVENKVLVLDGAFPQPVPRPAGPPWTIGWFGNLRCRKTLETLTKLAHHGNGMIEVVIAGKASPAEFPDFVRQSDRPNVRYLGPYTADQLPALYAQCHFAWAIDWFEEGLNSTWLLPNRLYEATACGVVAIALRSVETGRWLSHRGAGLLLSDGAEGEQLLGFVNALSASDYEAMFRQLQTVSRSDLVADIAECKDLVAAVAG